ncbi:hypothetical protein RJ640_001988 [Escallonia rubra]|uniref:Uncharacterized protein n=1 Tax=Escallonia rubra TaxID=112253 RepID=A0AA88US90_9ASTE|nr:hypothetical protein RJ640_001988 [Escallonia rubra]
MVYTEGNKVSVRSDCKATNRPVESNLIGNASIGSVYRGVVSDGIVVAIKVYKLHQEKSVSYSVTFATEISLKSLPIALTLTSEPWVLEYMPNGSLEKLRHSQNSCLDFMQRLDKMID